MSAEDCKPEMYGTRVSSNPFRNDFVNELSGDVSSLKLSQRYNDRVLSQSFLNDKTHLALNGPEESGWFSGLAESCGSCNTSKTFMYDSLNTQISHDRLEYTFDSNIPAEIASDDLGFSNMTLPLLDYYPNYEGEKMNDLTPTDSHGTSPLSVNKQMNPQNGMYKSVGTAYSTILSPENISSFDNPTARMASNYRKPSYQTPIKESYVFLKILATQLVSGTIIGRGGKGLNWFRRKSKVDDIVLSMPWEVYPKTEYRTLLLKGTLKSVIKATCIIADLMNSRYSFMAEDNMMVMVVLPEVFLTAMEEIKRTTNQSVLAITLFRDDNVQHQEIVAVLKGNKSKIKDLVAAISTSISETISPEKYCFVSYPSSDIQNNCGALASDANNEALRRQAKWPLDSSITLGSCPKVIKQLKNNDDTLEDLFNGLESLTDHKGNIITNSTIASIINNKPEILSSNLDVNINLHESLPDSIIEVASVYNCIVNQTTNETDKTIRCKITGPFTGCFATVLVILNRTSESPKEL